MDAGQGGRPAPGVGLLTPWSFMYRPQALHTGSPSALRRHSVVVVVWQLAQERPTRRDADCNTGDKLFKSKKKASAAVSTSQGVLRGWALSKWAVGAGSNNPM